MEPKLKYLIDNELSGSVKEALNAATQALYFADSSDYQTALWDVITALLEGSVPEYAGDEFINKLAQYLNPEWRK